MFESYLDEQAPMVKSFSAYDFVLGTMRMVLYAGKDSDDVC